MSAFQMHPATAAGAPSAPADEIAYLTVGALLDAYRSRRLSPVEVMKAALARLAPLDRKLNAFCFVDEETALEAARASERRWLTGDAGPLDGVPVSIKDIVLTRGWPTLRGSRLIRPDQPWEEDGPAVARLREAGAILFGKTTTPEFAAKPVTVSPLTGISRNPWNLALTPGGSSGGAAAAVAAGLGPLALGTDAGGSIRIPASLCGVFGHKPSGGRVPMHPPTPYATLAAFGPISRSVADAALMLDAIARPDPRDWTALPYQPTDYAQRLDEAEPRRWRIAWSRTLGYAHVDPEVARITETAVERLARSGPAIELVEHVFDDPQDLLKRLKRGLTAYAFRHLSDADFALMDPGLVAEIAESRGAALIDHLQAEMDRAAFGQHMVEFHQRFDLLLTPTLAVPAFPTDREQPHGYGRYDWIAFTYPFNLTRQPAATVPCGFTADGLPVGLQIVGPMHDDGLVLQAARLCELVLPWAERRPQLETADDQT